MTLRAVRSGVGVALALGAALYAVACGGPAAPTPNPGGNNGGSNQQPPPNSLPVIEAITIQGTRPKQPANFADLDEIVTVTARVHDDETPIEQLQYEWSAPVGTFNGTGAVVSWQAPASASTPAAVPITVKVVEKYGFAGIPPAFQHDSTATATLSLHDSVREVGEMSRQFLLDFSDTNIKDAGRIMRNFGGPDTCPDPREVDSERNDVINNYTNFVMMSFRIGDPVVTVKFGGFCPFRNKQGDACAVVPSRWDSVDKRDNTRGTVDGNDIIAAAYSPRDARWWLCASDYDGHLVTGVAHPFYLRR